MDVGLPVLPFVQQSMHSSSLECLGYRTRSALLLWNIYVLLRWDYGVYFISHWWLDYKCCEIFRWFLGCLYLLCGCLMVDVEVKFWISYEWLFLCLLCFLELVRRFFWGLIFVALWGLIFIAIINIPIHSCDINVSNRTTSTVCEYRLIWFISG